MYVKKSLQMSEVRWTHDRTQPPKNFEHSYIQMEYMKDEQKPHVSRSHFFLKTYALSIQQSILNKLGIV